MNSYQIVARGYLLKLRYHIPICCPETPFEESHLVWMLQQIYNDKLSSETKAHRWLGYVQGILAMKGYIDVNDERDNTRHIFKGE